MRARETQPGDELEVAEAIAKRGGLQPHEDMEYAGEDGQHWAITARGEGGWSPVIENVDCTPRPRFRETTAALAERMRRHSAQRVWLEQWTATQNRTAALRTGTWPDGGVYHVTACACGWHGLRQADPEVARREYDAHACSINGDTAVDRAAANVDRLTYGPKRERSSMVDAVRVEADETVQTKTEDETEQRMALLEIK